MGIKINDGNKRKQTNKRDFLRPKITSHEMRRTKCVLRKPDCTFLKKF